MRPVIDAPSNLINPVLKQPAPDFAEFARVLRGEQAPRRVHLAELTIDDEVLAAIYEHYMGERWAYTDHDVRLRQFVKMYYHLGYDYVPVWPAWRGHPAAMKRIALDTAQLPHAARNWVNESQGLITSWQDFEAFPWQAIHADAESCEQTARHLPEGMKMAMIAIDFEHVMENLLGYEGLFYLMHDEPALVAAVFERWGQKVYDYYAAVVDMPEVGCIFHADDLGFKTGTLLSPAALSQHVFPWFKKYAALAHAHGKMYWYHCCGNIYANDVIGTLIDDVGIDALHSYQDVILPVADFKDRYGRRVAALGGVDVDRLATLQGDELRVYIRGILEHCQPGGRWALGSANSVPNYVPLENYCIMLDEGRRFYQ
jgi:uroporphyrinogen decarboxylase